MFWTDPHQYGATLFKDPLHTPMAFNPWVQGMPRFTPYPIQGVLPFATQQQFLPYPIPRADLMNYPIPQMNMLPYQIPQMQIPQMQTGIPYNVPQALPFNMEVVRNLPQFNFFKPFGVYC